MKPTIHFITTLTANAVTLYITPTIVFRDHPYSYNLTVAFLCWVCSINLEKVDK